MTPRGSDGILAMLLVFVALISLSCSVGPETEGPTSAATPAATDPPPSFGGATFVVEAPFSTARLELEPDGTIQYAASAPDTGVERQTGSRQVSAQDLSRLLDAVHEAGFLSLKDAYPYLEGVSYEDGSTYAVAVTLGGRTKRVMCYQSECPPGFVRVMEVIREIWGEGILEVGV